MAAKAPVAPTREEALAAAERLQAAGAARVLLFGSVARGEARSGSDIDLVAVFDEIDYADRRSIQVGLVATAEEAVGRRVEVHVTDWPEWRRRSEEVTASFEARIARNALVLYDRDPAGVRWDKEIGLPDSNEKEALARLAEADKALEGVLKNAAAGELELAATEHGAETEAVIRWERRMVEVCRLGALAVETGLKALVASCGKTPQGTHLIHILVKELDGAVRAAVEDSLEPLARNAVSDQEAPYSDVSMWSAAGDYLSVGPGAGTGDAARLGPLIVAAAVGVTERAARELARPPEPDPLVEMAVRTSRAVKAMLAAGDLETGPAGAGRESSPPREEPDLTS